MTHLRSWQVGLAEMLREWYAHLLSTAAGETEAERARAAYDEMRHAIGYTALHRLCALRMAEERRVIVPCVGRGRDSDGFRMYMNIVGNASLGPHDEAYTFFLARVIDELAQDLPAVFDQRIAAALVFPGPKALEAGLAELNASDVAPLWTDDETLGWIFEDYNDPDERKEMRKHDAPRNAREPAVRNQFFTPRWVVEFLTDNTLGRLWVDRTAGQSELVERCRFLNKRSEHGEGGEASDPRDISVLDPACGSGHFLLYAYDLLEVIYREAWSGRACKSPGRKPLREEYPEESAFLAEIPRLILRENLFGVDIDQRCIQEAALTLWLRAHKSWQALGICARQRPRVEKVNLVCAQAMPNAPELKAKVIGKLKPAILGRLAEELLTRAGEMGVLLYWPITTPSGTSTFWVYAPRLNAGTIPSIVNKLRANVEQLRDERERLEARGSSERANLTQLVALKREVMEREALRNALSELVARGYEPHPDDGYVVTASPLHVAFRLPKWRDLLRTTFAELQKGELDWAHLAMRLRPAQVRAKCRTDLSLAIAHGLEAECDGRTRDGSRAGAWPTGG
ncbi:MAG: hypothetical protein MUF54_08750 [Polyangiaceae bacterium]|nr:hypothetical protein [Polyangiaceae bacterium]